MTYILDTHILVWLLDNNVKLKDSYRQILVDKNDDFVIPAIVLAEFKYLSAQKRIKLTFEQILEYLYRKENCIFYPIDEKVVKEMPKGLNIHDALIVATGLVYKNVLGEEVKILTVDEEIVNSGYLPVA